MSAGYTIYEFHFMVITTKLMLKEMHLDPIVLRIFALQMTSFNSFILWKSSWRPSGGTGSSDGRFRGFP